MLSFVSLPAERRVARAVRAGGPEVIEVGLEELPGGLIAAGLEIVP
jgi:hypothetical protein